MENLLKEGNVITTNDVYGLKLKMRDLEQENEALRDENDRLVALLNQTHDEIQKLRKEMAEQTETQS